MRRLLEQQKANLEADILTIQADVAKDKYFLEVATAYSDTLAMGDLNARIATLNARLLSSQTTLSSVNADLATLPNY